MWLEQEEGDFGRFDGVGGREGKPQAVVLVAGIDGVVKDADVHGPFFEVRGGDEGYAGGKGALDLGGLG